jgi:hypothetical protein
MSDTDLAPCLWTPEEIVAIYRRLLTYGTEHPEDASPRLMAQWRQRMASAERDAVREKQERMANARERSNVHPLMGAILDCAEVHYGHKVRQR